MNLGGLMRFRNTAAVMAAGVLAGAALSVLPATPAIADTATPSPRILLDETNQHVYLATEGQTSFVEVFNLDGVRVATIDNQPSASGMALSPDGRTLYIAHAEAGTISAVSTATFQQTALYQTDVAPVRLAFAGGRLWFSYHELYSSSAGIGSVDVLAQTPTVQRDLDVWQWTDVAPNVLADPANPNTLVVTSDGGNGGLGVFDVSTGTAVQKALNDEVGLFYDAAVTGDGKDVIVPQGDAVQYYKLTDLMPDGPAVAVVNTPSALAVARDGTIAVGTWSYWSVPPVGVSIVVPGEAGPRWRFAPQINEGGLAWSSDGRRLYGASGGSSGLGDTDPVLNVFQDPERGDTTMTLTPPADAATGTPFTVRGSLTSAAPFAAGQTVHVTRTDAADPDGVTLPDAAVDADGSFSFSDTESAEGDVSYLVYYDGDQVHVPASESTSVTVTEGAPALTDTTLYLSFENRAKVGSKLKMSGRLSSALSIPANATVRITRQDATGPVPALVGTRKVAADGTFQIADVPLVAGPAVYTVTFEGDDAYKASTVSATIQVSP